MAHLFQWRGCIKTCSSFSNEERDMLFRIQRYIGPGVKGINIIYWNRDNTLLYHLYPIKRVYMCGGVNVMLSYLSIYSAFLKYYICCKLAAAEILQTALMTNLQQCDIDSTQNRRSQYRHLYVWRCKYNVSSKTPQISINILRISFPLLDMASPFDRNGHLFICQISHYL